MNISFITTISLFKAPYILWLCHILQKFCKIKFSKIPTLYNKRGIKHLILVGLAPHKILVAPQTPIFTLPHFYTDSDTAETCIVWSDTCCVSQSYAYHRDITQCSECATVFWYPLIVIERDFCTRDDLRFKHIQLAFWHQTCMYSGQIQHKYRHIHNCTIICPLNTAGLEQMWNYDQQNIQISTDLGQLIRVGYGLQILD